MARQNVSVMQRERQRRLNERRIRLRARRLSAPRATARRLRVRATQRSLMRRVRNSEGIPSYDIDVTRVDGNIHTVTFVPITTGDNNYSIEAAQRVVAGLIRQLVSEEVRHATGWSKERTTLRVRGYVQITNTMNPVSSQFYRFTNLGQIKQKDIDEIFSQMQQSETDVPFENMEFMLVIDPETYRIGAGSELTLKRGKGLGWETYYDEEGPINCAAIAITLLTKKERFDQKKPLLKK